MNTEEMKPTSEPCFSQGEKVKFHRTTIAICGPAGVLSEEKIEANAEFIAEAFTVFHETGLTPREILEQRNALWDAAENIAHYPVYLGPGFAGPSIRKEHMTEIKDAIKKVMSEGAKGDTPA